MSAGAVFTLRYTLRFNLIVRRLGSLSIGAFKELRQNKDELKIGNKKKKVKTPYIIFVIVILSEETEIEWKFQSEGGDIGFGIQRKLAR